MEFSITVDSCRVCLKKSLQGRALSDPLPYGDTTEASTYLDMFLLCSGFRQPEYHKLVAAFYPQVVCRTCEELLLRAYEFRRKSSRTEKVLNNVLMLYEEEDEMEHEVANSAVENDGLYKTESEEYLDPVSVPQHSEEIRLDEKDTNTVPAETVDDGCQQLVLKYEDIATEEGEKKTFCSDDDTTGYEALSELEDFGSIDLKTSQCPDCGKLVSKRYLPRHRDTHIDDSERERPFVCDMCTKRFTLKENLLKHKRIHSDDKRYKCPHCDEWFLHWASRRYHVERVHTKVKRFTCEYCGVAFRQSSHYQVHLRRHTGSAPFICHLCGYKFVTTSSLKLHMFVHSERKEYNCAICDKQYKTSKSLQLHQRTHRNEKNYVCHICQKRFTQNHVLRSHHRKTHPECPLPPPGTVVNEKALQRLGE